MYNKIFTQILDSSIWLEPNATRIVWLTFLAAMDEDGHAHFASIKNLAHRARVTLDECKDAIQCLESPDPDSSDTDNEGKRIEKIPGGWVVLNAIKYRDIVTRSIAKEKTRLRVQRFRERNAGVTVANVLVTQSDTYTEAYTQDCGCGTKPPTTAAAAVDELVKKNVQGVDDAKDFELSCMEPQAAMALLEREHPDIDVWGEFRKLNEKCKNQGTKPTWRGFVGWLRKASPVARIPKRTKTHEVSAAPDREQELESRTNAIRTLQEWRKSGVSYQGIKNKLNGQEGAFPSQETA